LLVLCGHGDYGDTADARVAEIAAQSRAAGAYPDFLIYGNETYARRRRKHNFLIGPAPAFAYTFINALQSSAEQVVFVGNEDTRQIYLALMDYFAPRGRRFDFISESRLGFAANVEAGKRALYGDGRPD